MKTPELLCMGEVLWDCFPTTRQFGGAPANVACQAARLGVHTALWSAIGDDDDGREALKILKHDHVDDGQLQVVPAAETGKVDVRLDALGKPTFTIRPGAAWDHLVYTDRIRIAILEAKAVSFGTLGQRSPDSRQAIRSALHETRQADKLRVLDVNLRAPFFDDDLIRDSIAFCNVLKLSDEELPAVLRATGVSPGTDDAETLRRVLGASELKLIAMTRGEQGALLVSASEVADQPALPTTVVDTVGAGDAFTASMIVSLLGAEPLPMLALKACQLAAATCAHAGGVPPRRANTAL